MRRVCLASDSFDSQLEARADKLEPLTSPAPCCEAVLLCCSTINDDLALKPPPFLADSQNANESLLYSTRCHRKTVKKVIMGVRFTEAAISRLADERRKSRSKLFLSVLRSLNVSSFNGIAILLRDIPEKSDKSAVSVIGTLSKELRRHSYTIMLLLPYKVGHDDAYGEKLRELKRFLIAPYQIFLYPEARMLGNTMWPSPSEVGFPSRQDKRDGISVCHLFNRQPFLVSLFEVCDTRKIQAIEEPKRPYLEDVAYAYSLWNQSWASRTYRYSTYTCSGRTGIVYQTRKQAEAFYRDVPPRVQSLCYGLGLRRLSFCVPEESAHTEAASCFRKDCFLE